MRSAAVMKLVTGHNRQVCQCESDVRFSNAARTYQNDVLGTLHERQMRQLDDLRLGPLPAFQSSCSGVLTADIVASFSKVARFAVRALPALGSAISQGSRRS